ncbi:hypothetical protein QGN29_01910 [Temperatibacter marinus]|uniref:Uncharacterized protein n=1 Tax=Temperatibacter marinus TaxID=1456591 RepID=A0AA52EE95_9PROT|nr:hypothetical protein [Temperatibacter marinus]WND03120.1 hypothetical protein QGN29_01910 [Temperatibacter marinus]
MAAKKRKNNEGTVALLIIMGLMIGGLMLYNNDLGIFVFLSILPTVTALFNGSDVWKMHRTLTVALLNFTGIIPYIKMAFTDIYTFESVAWQPVTFLIIWGLAGFGYMLLYVAPHVATYIIQSNNNRKVSSLVKQRQSLAEEWGNEVLVEKQVEEKPQFITPKRSR